MGNLSRLTQFYLRWETLKYGLLEWNHLSWHQRSISTRRHSTIEFTTARSKYSAAGEKDKWRVTCCRLWRALIVIWRKCEIRKQRSTFTAMWITGKCDTGKRSQWVKLKLYSFRAITLPDEKLYQVWPSKLSQNKQKIGIKNSSRNTPKITLGP